MNKKILTIALILPLLVIIIGGIYILSTSEKQKDMTNDTTDQPALIYDLKLEKNYISENSWKFKVTGQFPNPCYTASVDAIVAESYPEQVTILVDVSKPSDDMVCAQVISDFVYEGTFSASEQASVELKLKQN